MGALRLALPGLLDAGQREALDVDDDLAREGVLRHPLVGLAADVERRLAVAVSEPDPSVDGSERDRPRPTGVRADRDDPRPRRGRGERGFERLAVDGIEDHVVAVAG